MTVRPRSIADAFGGNGFDTLRFGAGIRPQDLTFVRDTRDPYNLGLPPDAGSLLVQIAGTDDRILIYRQYTVFDDVSGGIDRFVFDDGTVLTRAQIDELVNPGNLLVGTDAAETITGTAAGERIIGKKGNDLLQGNDGNDTYVWNLGDGSDHISEFSINSFDVVEFGIGVRPEDITISHIGEFGNEAQGYYLYLDIAPTGERLTIEWEFYVNPNTNQRLPAIEEFRFADGTVWTPDFLIARELASTPGDDVIRGFPNRADIMDGGAGNDDLDGEGGWDTYIFGRGYGVDTIHDGPDGSFFTTIVNTLQFDNTVSSTDIVLSRVSHDDPNSGQVIDTVFSIAGTADKLIVAGGASVSRAMRSRGSFGGDSAFWNWGP